MMSLRMSLKPFNGYRSLVQSIPLKVSKIIQPSLASNSTKNGVQSNKLDYPRLKELASDDLHPIHDKNTSIDDDPHSHSDDDLHSHSDDDSHLYSDDDSNLYSVSPKTDIDIDFLSDEKNYEYIKSTFFDLTQKMLQVARIDEHEDRQVLAMFISSYFLKVVDFKRGMNQDKKVYFQGIGMHFILEATECNTADEFIDIMDSFLDIVEQTPYHSTPNETRL